MNRTVSEVIDNEKKDTTLAIYEDLMARNDKLIKENIICHTQITRLESDVKKLNNVLEYLEAKMNVSFKFDDNFGEGVVILGKDKDVQRLKNLFQEVRDNEV